MPLTGVPGRWADVPSGTVTAPVVLIVRVLPETLSVALPVRLTTFANVATFVMTTFVTVEFDVIDEEETLPITDGPTVLLANYTAFSDWLEKSVAC